MRGTCEEAFSRRLVPSGNHKLAKRDGASGLADLENAMTSKLIDREPVRESLEGVSANSKVTKARMQSSQLITFDHVVEIGERHSDLVRESGTNLEDIPKSASPPLSFVRSRAIPLE